jgi:hypothetical protein
LWCPSRSCLARSAARRVSGAGPSRVRGRARVCVCVCGGER